MAGNLSSTFMSGYQMFIPVRVEPTESHNNIVIVSMMSYYAWDSGKLLISFPVYNPNSGTITISGFAVYGYAVKS